MRLLALSIFGLFACGTSETNNPDASSDASKAMDATQSDGTMKDGGGSDTAMEVSTSDAADASQDASFDAGPGTYTAYGLIGGLDRVRIVKSVGNLCFFIQLVSPNNNGQGLTLPAGWGFEYARALEPAVACNPSYLGPISNSFDATSQSGTIAFAGMGIPQTIQSIAATIVFANNPMWCPASVAFGAMNINVQ